MSDNECKWAGRNNPRTLPGRHADECADDACRGCQPCSEPHCRVCGHTHALGACAECMAEVRSNLHEIARLCGALPEEVRHRGIEGEAMMLLGPSADPEARGHLEASVAAGRVSEDYLADAEGDTHPTFVLLSWQMVWRDALEHDEARDHELTTAVDYLDQQMTYMGGYEFVPFEDFAGDLRRCVSHLESVLHDGEQRDEGVPCLKCGRPLTRLWGEGAAEDGWQCVKCHTRSTEAQYRLAVQADYIDNAEWLIAADCVTRAEDAGSEVGLGTIRVWAAKGKVRKKRDTGRTVYNVKDVLDAALARELAS